MDATQRQQIMGVVRKSFTTPQQTIQHLTQQTPRSVYDFIHAAYPGQFRLLAKGLEQNEAFQREMRDFLQAKYDAQRKLSPAAAEEWEIYFLQNTEKK